MYLKIPSVISVFDLVVGFGSSWWILNNFTDKWMSKNDVNIKIIPNSVDLKKLRKLGREYNWDIYKLYTPTPNPKFIEKSIINGGNVLIWGAP